MLNKIVLGILLLVSAQLHASLAHQQPQDKIAADKKTTQERNTLALSAKKLLKAFE